MLKLIHAADLHLDSPFEALGERKAAQRRSEQRGLLGRIVSLAGERQADALLLTGDLFDSADAYSETARCVASELGKAPCPVFISPGNHDFYSLSSPWTRLELPENVHVFTSPRLECVELPGKGARVWGAAFCDKYSALLSQCDCTMDEIKSVLGKRTGVLAVLNEGLYASLTGEHKGK